MSISEKEKPTIQEKPIAVKKLKTPVKPPKKSANEMTFMEHLGELRNRLVVSAIVVALGTAVGWFFHKELVDAFLQLAREPMREISLRTGRNIDFINTNVVNGFAIFFEVAMYAGFLLASPFLVYQILDFMSPALDVELKPSDPGYEAEVKMLGSIKRSLVFFIPLVAIFFLAGIAFAYYLVLPSAIKFLLSFGADQFATMPDVKPYISMLSKIMFWSGLIFELPIFLFLLAKIRVVTWRKLASWWKWALVLSLVVAAFITPSPDIFNQALISVPVFGLYWLGVLFARFA